MSDLESYRKTLYLKQAEEYAAEQEVHAALGRLYSIRSRAYLAEKYLESYANGTGYFWAPSETGTRTAEELNVIRNTLLDRLKTTVKELVELDAERPIKKVKEG